MNHLVALVVLFSTVTALGEAPRSSRTTVPARDIVITLRAGSARDALLAPVRVPTRSDFVLTGELLRGLTDRLTMTLLSPCFAYRLGEAGEREWVPWGGICGWTFGSTNALGVIGAFSLSGGLAMRQYLSADSSLIATAEANSLAEFWDGYRQLPTRWTGYFSFGYSRTIERVTVNLGIGWGQLLIPSTLRDPMGDDRFANRAVLTLGSVQELAMRTRPLVQLHLNPSWTLNLHASASLNVATGRFRDAYLAGFTYHWI